MHIFSDPVRLVRRFTWVFLVFTHSFILQGRVSAEEEAAQYHPLTRKQVGILLVDPLSADPQAASLIRRRVWLAHQGGSHEAFCKVATEFESMGAYYASAELLWFAIRLIPAPKQFNTMVTKMNDLVKESQVLDEELDSIEQLWGSGRTQEAITDLIKISREYPRLEKPHFHLARYHYGQYVARENTRVALMDRDLRIKVFRICYEQLMLTLALDPLYDRAYYYLGRIRDILHDEAEFIEQTQWMSSRSLNFRIKLQPSFSRLQEGEISVRNFIEAGEGFEEVGVYPYAVFSYQAAMRVPGVEDDVKSWLKNKIRRLLDEKIPLG